MQTEKRLRGRFAHFFLGEQRKQDLTTIAAIQSFFRFNWLAASLMGIPHLMMRLPSLFVKLFMMTRRLPTMLSQTYSKLRSVFEAPARTVERPTELRVYGWIVDDEGVEYKGCFHRGPFAPASVEPYTDHGKAYWSIPVTIRLTSAQMVRFIFAIHQVPWSKSLWDGQYIRWF